MQKYITYNRIKIRQRLDLKRVPDAQVLDSTKGQTNENGNYSEEIRYSEPISRS